MMALETWRGKELDTEGREERWKSCRGGGRGGMQRERIEVRWGEAWGIAT
jgi:hypothetical protein